MKKSDIKEDTEIICINSFVDHGDKYHNRKLKLLDTIHFEKGTRYNVDVVIKENVSREIIICDNIRKERGERVYRYFITIEQFYNNFEKRIDRTRRIINEFTKR